MQPISTRRSSRRAWLRAGLLLGAAAALLTCGAAPARAQDAPSSNVYAWGYNYYGLLGDGTAVNRSTAGAAAAPADAVAVAGGELHSLALKADGTVVAWGYNYYGQIGDGSQYNIRWTPVPVRDPADPSGFLTNVCSVAAGFWHGLALKADGTVVAWGWNNYGQLGDGTTTNRLTPVPVRDPADPSGFLTNVCSVAAGFWHDLALKADGTVVAWGSNWAGQLGDGTRTLYRFRPVPVQDPADPSGFLTDVVSIAAGNDYSVALKADGRVVVWGSNSAGQFGDGTPGTLHPTPVPVRDPADPSGFLTNVSSVAAGFAHILAVKGDGTVVAWGWNAYGQIGDGTIAYSRSTPVPVRDPADPSGFLTNVCSVAAGGGHSLALKADGTVAAWGYNEYGQLGDGTTTNRLTPVSVLDPADPSGFLTNVVSLTAGGLHSLAVKGDGTASGCDGSGDPGCDGGGDPGCDGGGDSGYDPGCNSGGDPGCNSGGDPGCNPGCDP